MRLNSLIPDPKSSVLPQPLGYGQLLVILSCMFAENTKELDYGVSRQKSLFEKCFGLRFQLTQGMYVQ